MAERHTLCGPGDILGRPLGEGWQGTGHPLGSMGSLRPLGVEGVVLRVGGAGWGHAPLRGEGGGPGDVGDAVGDGADSPAEAAARADV